MKFDNAAECCKVDVTVHCRKVGASGKFYDKVFRVRYTKPDAYESEHRMLVHNWIVDYGKDWELHHVVSGSSTGTRVNNFVHDYFIVEVPEDVSDDMAYRLQIAISEANEDSELYCVPANWVARHVADETYEVIRTRKETGK